MKPFLVYLSLFLPTVAHADSFILGAGSWTCQKVVTAADEQDLAKIYQAVGWLLGYWSAETRYKGDDFVNIVEQAGGEAIYNQTVTECRKAPEGTLLYELANSMIDNTH